SSCAAQAASLTVSKTIVMLGQTPFAILTYASEEDGQIYYHPHADETTALEALKIIVKKNGGEVITLSNHKRRLITFKLDQKYYVFDPNRIYTSAGIHRTLRKYGPYSDTAFRAVKHFAKVITAMLPRKLIITAHNNTPHHYSSARYCSGHKLSRDASRVSRNLKLDPDDFIYVTTLGLYKKLKPYKFNLVLQSAKTVIDDGSLSVYALYRNIPYVNVEAGYGHLSKQLKMLNAVNKISKD
ncbi:MAG: hypothetical protein KDH94_08025, partial [Coxiellaceae bacterium]|nr:hypothetical protein [Coxiellaceae bacterium]